MEQQNIIIALDKQNEIKELQNALLTILEQLTLELETPFEHHNKQKLTHCCYWATRLLKATFEEQHQQI